MKRFILFITPFLIALIIFFGILLFLNREIGKGALLIISVPPSNVYLDGKLVGKTRFCMATENCKNKMGVDVGEHSIRLISVDGKYPPYDTKITINKLTLTVLDRTFGNDGESEGTIVGLSPLSDKSDAEISVTSLPDKANVFLDGNPIGITPLLLKQVSESDHELRFTLDGYKDELLKIKTTLGFQINASVFLGVKTDLSDLSLPSTPATPSAAPAVANVLILDTPTGFLRVRESNSISSAEVGKINPGESYELVNEKDGWFEIKISSSGARLGWISSQYAIKK
jgi:hypothetical protein